MYFVPSQQFSTKSLLQSNEPSNATFWEVIIIFTNNTTILINIIQPIEHQYNYMCNGKCPQATYFATKINNYQYDREVNTK